MSVCHPFTRINVKNYSLHQLNGVLEHPKRCLLQCFHFHIPKTKLSVQMKLSKTSEMSGKHSQKVRLIHRESELRSVKAALDLLFALLGRCSGPQT